MHTNAHTHKHILRSLHKEVYKIVKCYKKYINDFAEMHSTLLGVFSFVGLQFNES